MKPPKPRLRPQQTVVPLPRPRPEPDRLGSGNSNVMPRLRPGDVPVLRVVMAQGGLLAPDTTRPPQTGGLLQPQGLLEGAQLADARASLNPDVNFAPGTTFDSIFRREQTGNARTREAQAITGPLNYEQRTGPPQVGTMMDFPFASRWTEAPPPPSPGEQVAGSASPTTPPSPPPPTFQPTPDNPGYGLPGMPPNATFPGAVGDTGEVIRQAIEKAIMDALIGLRIQPQPNQPAYSDQYATPSQPPAFAPPMGAYR